MQQINSNWAQNLRKLKVSETFQSHKRDYETLLQTRKRLRLKSDLQDWEIKLRGDEVTVTCTKRLL